MTMGRSLFPALLTALLLAVPLSAQGPTGTVAGRVVSATQQPLSNAAVSIANRRAVTGPDGRFTLTGVPVGTDTLRATLIGYGPVARPVSVVAGQTTTIDVSLAPQALALEGLVVIGYGQQTQRDLTGVVQTVTPEEFNTGRIVSPEKLIQGKVAGVQVIDSNEPGAGISLRIRGGTSVTSSNEPLYVVDGVPLAVGGGISAGRNPLNFLNPNDIANVTVLKDASATAIYGSRGANGVVIIETKKGGRGPQITYNGSVSGSIVAGGPDLLSTQQFRAAVQEYAPNNMKLLGDANTNWRDAVERSALGQEHNLAVSGAGDNTDYRLSVGYLDQDGVVRGTTTKRVSGAVNINQQLFDDHLNLTANVKGARTEDRFTPGGVLGSATAFAPTQPIRDASSPYGGFFEFNDALAPNNPVAELQLITDQGNTYRSVGDLEAQYRLPFYEPLSATVRLGYDVTKAERESFYPSFLRSQVEGDLGGTVTRSNPTQSHSVLDSYLNYEKTLDAYDSNVDATAGYSYEDFRSEFPSFYAQGLSSDLLGVNGIPAAEDVIPSLGVDESKLASFFGRVNYTFRDRYLLTLSVRRDGSSKFGPGNQWGTFPSAALAWRISDEPFMDRFGALSDLKLRASYGVNGNQAFGSYLAYTSYTIGNSLSQVQFGDRFVTTIRPGAVDPNIKWEETTGYNLGLDYGFWDNRVSGAIEYYSKKTDDLIFNVPVAAGTNLSNFVTTNIGSLKNRGFEFNVNARVLDGGNRGFSWNAGFNASTNHNELLQINAAGAGSEQILTGGIAGGVGSTIQVLQPGYPINSFFVYRQKYNSDGTPVYADTNGDGTINENDLYEDLNGDGIVNQADRAPFHNSAPAWILGQTSDMGYRNWDFSYTLLAYLGNYVYNNVASDLGHYSALQGNTPVNLHASVLATGFVNPQYFSDYYVEKASFLRMNNITLGYTFAGFRALKDLRLFGTVQNAFTLTGYSGIDPTAGVNGIDNNIYPRSRTYTFGLSTGF